MLLFFGAPFFFCTGEAMYYETSELLPRWYSFELRT